MFVTTRGLVKSNVIKLPMVLAVVKGLTLQMFRQHGFQGDSTRFLLVQNENRKSSFGSALFMDSLESRNSNSRARAWCFIPIELQQNVRKSKESMDSLTLAKGCTQLTREDYNKLKPRVQGGSLLYNFCPEDAD